MMTSSSTDPRFLVHTKDATAEDTNLRHKETRSASRKSSGYSQIAMSGERPLKMKRDTK